MKAEKQTTDFALCIENRDCDDLEKGKVYRVVTDRDAIQEGCLRIIDESAEDYLYPAAYFVPLDLPQEAQNALTGPIRPRAAASALISGLAAGQSDAVRTPK